MARSGKLIVIGFFVVALTLAGGAVWYQYVSTRWALGFWGTETAELIVRAKGVRALRLEPAAPGEQSDLTMSLNGREYRIAEKRFISNSRGLIHMRMALVEDANFEPEAVLTAPPTWDYLLQFAQNSREFSLLIDSKAGLVRARHGEQIASIKPIADGMRKFLEEQFAPPADSP